MPAKKHEIEEDIARVRVVQEDRGDRARDTRDGTRGVPRYYPGGRGGGGGRRGRGPGVVLPHARTSSGCTKCGQYHTTAEHERHAKKTKKTKKTPTAKKSTTKRASSTKTAKTKKAKTKMVTHGAPRQAVETPPSDAEVARVVHDAIREIGTPGRYGTNKVFVSEIWAVASRDPRFRKMTAAEFKRALVRANRLRLIDLARADLVGAMNPEQVRASEIVDLGSSFHFVLDPTARRGDW